MSPQLNYVPLEARNRVPLAHFKWYIVQLRRHTRAKMMKERKERQPAENAAWELTQIGRPGNPVEETF